MARASDAEALLQAWRALAGGSGGEGWRTIPLELGSPCRVLAGRRLPGDEEAVLVGFESVRLPSDAELPRGQGFRVATVAAGGLGGTHVWLALSRRSAGSPELFAMMAADILDLLGGVSGGGSGRLLRVFLNRIRAWQDFMERGHERVLGPEAEVGLAGELVVLGALVDAGLPPGSALDAWQGPRNGLHDFVIGAGAIEVKATVSTAGFPARIGSLEQLDDSIRQPLFVGAVRLAVDPAGSTLVDLVAGVRVLFAGDADQLSELDGLLIRAGFLDEMAGRYVRRFALSNIALLPVTGGFPRLTRMNVGAGIRAARYEIDLDQAGVADFGLAGALERLRQT